MGLDLYLSASLVQRSVKWSFVTVMLGFRGETIRVRFAAYEFGNWATDKEGRRQETSRLSKAPLQEVEESIDIFLG